MPRWTIATDHDLVKIEQLMTRTLDTSFDVDAVERHIRRVPGVVEVRSSLRPRGERV